MLYHADPVVRFTTVRADCGSLYVAWTVFNSKICDVIYSTVIYSSSDFTYITTSSHREFVTTNSQLSYS